MNDKTVDLIYKHAVTAQKTFAQFLNQSSQADLFKKYFHLRPTSDGITIVSTLPDAPMRGVYTKDSADLMQKLSSIDAVLNKLVSENRKQILDTLEELGFKRRSTKSILEEDAQATFIRGMISNEPSYQGIQFIASELTLEQGMRFDVVGYRACDDTLYLFELKKGRTTSAAEQVSKYCEHIRKNKSDFEKIFSSYPNLSLRTFSNIKGIAVMKFSENSSDSIWNNNAKQYGVEIWMYGSSLNFPKRYY
ncbi:MAG: hypothetical protein IKC03_04370 [Oscillospiraceae bacterium]|nr:hypothetical protein [Oscillospiraceae bacterium]